MEWSDEVVILSKVPYGESSVILTVMSENHGKWAGFVKGRSSKQPGRTPGIVFECGNIAQCRWRSRIADNLGNMVLESKMYPFVFARASKHRLIAVKSVCDLCLNLCPERQVIKGVYGQLSEFLKNIGSLDWLLNYVRFEIKLLQYVGYGLDLEKCAVTGSTDDLVYVSPKTGRAVSKGAGEPYKDKLLRLPGFLINQKLDNEVNWQDIFDGLDLGEYFFQKVFSGYSKTLPRSRAMLLQELDKDYKNVREQKILQDA